MLTSERSPRPFFAAPWDIMTVRVVDCETTSIDPAADAIIEIASVDLLGEGQCGRPGVMTSP
jgi:DNA polymerase III epsilon subunit-like protein